MYTAYVLYIIINFALKNTDEMLVIKPSWWSQRTS